MDGYCVVFVTAPSQEEAQKIGEFIVNGKAGACVNIVELNQSIFFWQGSIHNEKEYLLIIKTKFDRFNQLKNLIKSIHPYTVPEIIAMPIVAANQEYLNWIEETLNR